jgi:hypothetical protein
MPEVGSVDVRLPCLSIRRSARLPTTFLRLSFSLNQLEMQLSTEALHDMHGWISIRSGKPSTRLYIFMPATLERRINRIE